MSRFIKHVGQIMSTQEKCIVIFREIPKEPENCLVVQTADLTEEDHNDLINEVESITAQQLNDLANHLHTRFFRDGSNMLQKLDADKKLIKIPCSKIMMTPTPTDNISLNELNEHLRTIADPLKEQQTESKQVDTIVAGDDIKPSSVSETDDGILDDLTLAKGFLSQADTMEAEAKNLREQAYDLVPKRKLNAMLKKENASA